jgi:alkylation response protein AidB-like acyl-CoA dehydrogenase
MPLAMTEEQRQLADAVSQFATRHAPVDKTRATFDAIASGELPQWWPDFVVHGFHAVHLPEDVGGQGGTLFDMACVVEAAAKALLPGPWLSTVTAGAVALSAGTADDPATATLLRDVAAGATATVVLPEHSDYRAVACDDGWRLSGSSGLTMGIVAAQRIVVPARTEAGDELWFVLDVESSAVRAEPRNGTDLCTDVGVLQLTDHAVTPESRMERLDGERARCVVATLGACAAAGTVRWCLDAAVDYLRTREQFGKPIGTFQALQHKAAMLAVNTELAEAAAWDALRATDESVEQHRFAAAGAALMAVATSPDLVLDALLMFGAIGFTWEHDLHLYWRRATSLAASVSPTTRWSRAAGVLARTTTRSTALNLGDVESEFRARVAETLDLARTLTNDGPSRQDQRPDFDIGPRRDLLAEAGLVAPQLPVPWGLGASALQQVIVAEEFAARPDLLKPNLGIAQWMAPTIIDAGSDMQRERFVKPTLRGVLQWCQLNSEPGAGSDLASLTTRATKVDGGWVVNGRKIWTSMADRAHFGALLARTDPDAPKHRGLSYFLVDMESDGLEASPIVQANGENKFCEVVFTDVFVGDDMMVGQPGDGWNLAVGAMAVERTAIGGYVSIDRVDALRSLAAVEGPDRDAVLVQLGELEAYSNALKALVTRETLRLVDGQNPGPASSVAKVAMAVLLRRAATAVLGSTGRSAMVQDSEPEVFTPYFHLPSELIGGGTVEVQLTVIAQMILGLPRK